MRKIQKICILFLFVTNSYGQKTKYILNEEFNSNTLGWVEEYTDGHITEIKDGYLFLKSIDTSKYQTSNAPMNKCFLLGLPKSFEIESCFILEETQASMNFGILLNSSSVNYRFYLSDSSTGGVSEYDANRDSELIISSNSNNIEVVKIGMRIDFRIKIDDRNYEFFVNNKLYANGILNSKSWFDLRLFTTSGTAIRIDFLKIH